MARAEKKQNMLTPEEKLAQALVPEAEWPYQVPDNWCWTRIRNLCVLRNGRAFKPKEWSETGLPIVRIQNLNNPQSEYNYYSGEVEEDHKLYGGELLFAWSGTPGTSFGAHIWNGHEAVLNQHIFRVDINEEYINKAFIMYAINQQIEMLISVAHGGAGLQHVTKGVFESTPIVFPPYREQQRIVDCIESLFAKLDEAKEKAQAVVDSYEDRKAAILHRAFTGQLTVEWRKESNISIKEWVPYTYSELGSSKLGKMLDREKNIGRTVPYLRNINVRWFSFDLGDVSTMLASDEEIENLRVRDGDLFICEGGEPGRCAIWYGGNVEMIFQKALHRFRPNYRVKSEYLCYYLYYLTLNGSLEKYFTGTTIKHLTGKSLAEIRIMLPPIPEQTRIITLLKDLLSSEQQAKESAEQIITQIDTMKKSILARAFRGELGTNDPDDENAIELLQKVLEIDTPPLQRKKGVTIPKELSTQLKTELEKKIVKLYFQKNVDCLSINDVMKTSSKPFDVLEALYNLEERKIIKKTDDKHYRLVREVYAD